MSAKDHDEAAADRAWEEAKPRSSWRDKHGREELLVHPFLLTGAAPVPRRARQQRQS